MVALIEAAQSPGFSAEIVLVLSDDPAAAGLSLARNLGVAAEAIDFRAYTGKPAFEAALHARLASASIDIVCLAGFMRVLSAVLRRAMARTDAQHSSLAVAESARPQHPRARARPRACRTRLHGSPRYGGTRRRPDPRSRRACRFFRGTPPTPWRRASSRRSTGSIRKPLTNSPVRCGTGTMTGWKRRRRRRPTVKQAARPRLRRAAIGSIFS